MLYICHAQDAMKDLSDIPFFFIIGRPRSGTTLIQSLFDAHPNVQMPWECQLILNLYSRYGKIRVWTEEKLMDFYHDLFRQWQFHVWPIEKEKLRKELLACKGPTPYSTVCKVVYNNYISFFDKKEIMVFGDKNHGYSIYTRRLKKIFPEAKFIFIIRDYRDNFYSIKNVDFELPVVSLVVYKWKYFFLKVTKDARNDSGSYYFIRYEDFVVDPVAQFRKLCEFVGIDYVPEVFDFYKVGEEVKKRYPADVMAKHHASLFKPVSAVNVGKWEKYLSPRMVKIADHVAGKVAGQAGYSRKYVKASPWIKLQALPGICYAKGLYFLTYIIDKFPYRWRERILNRGPLLLARTFAWVSPSEKKPQ